MATSYTRQSSFSDGDTITAALFNDEFNQLLTAFSYASSSTTGHRHDGTAAEGGNIHTIGDQDFLNKIVADSTNNRWGVFVQVSSAAVEQVRFQDGVIVPVTDNDIDLGTSSVEFKDAFFDGTVTTDGLTVSSTTNLDGAIQLDNTLTAGVDGTGYDIKFFGDTAGSFLLWDQSDDALELTDSTPLKIGDSADMQIYHDGSNSYITNAVGALKLATETSGIVVTIGHTTSETTVADNLTITGNASIGGNLDVTGSFDMSDANITNLGSISLDTIVNDGTDITLDSSGDIILDAGGADIFFKDDGTTFGSATNTSGNLILKSGTTTALTFSGANVTGAGTYTGGGLMTTGGNIVIPDAGNIGSASDTDAIAISSGGVVTMNQIPVFSAGINVSGGTIAGTLATAAQGSVTSLGTLTALTVDDIAVNGKVITMTGSSSDTVVITAGTNGTLDITTTDAAAAAANIQITADGTVDIDSAGILTLDSGAAINIEPAAGSAILLDGTISIDAGVVTGATSITSTAFVGDITGDVTGNVDTFTATANNSTNETVYPVFVDGATGTQGAETDTGLTYNPSTGLVSSVGVTASGTVTYGSLSDGSITITAFVDEDDMSTDSATLVPTQQSVKAYVDSSVGSASGTMSSFILEDDDGTEISISNAEEVKFIGAGITTNWTDTTPGSDGDPFDMTFTVDAAQTGITSIYATDLIMGEDSQTAIDFGTANEIDFKVDNAARLTLTTGALYPVTDNQIDLGTSSLEFKDAFFDGTVTADAFAGPLTGNVTGNASGTALTVTQAAQTAITSVGTLTALTVDNLGINGNTITANSGALNLTPASGSAIVLDGTINVDAGVVTGATSITSTAFVGALTGNVTGNASGTAATVTTAAQSAITSLGTLTTLTVDNVIVNGTTIGHTSDTDLMTLGSAILTVAGEVSMTTLDIGGTNVTSTATELNLLDGAGTLKEVGKETIWVPAVAMYPETTNGCAAIAQVELSNGPELKCLDFATGADDFAQFTVAFPKSWNEGTVTFQAFWTVTGTNTGTVAWALAGGGMANDASINTAFGTAVVATALAHSGTSNDMMVSAESGAVTIANAAINTVTFFEVFRDVSADDQSGDARLLGIKLFFTTDAANDA